MSWAFEWMKKLVFLLFFSFLLFTDRVNAYCDPKPRSYDMRIGKVFFSIFCLLGLSLCSGIHLSVYFYFLKDLKCTYKMVSEDVKQIVSNIKKKEEVQTKIKWREKSLQIQRRTFFHWFIVRSFFLCCAKWYFHRTVLFVIGRKYKSLSEKKTPTLPKLQSPNSKA